MAKDETIGITGGIGAGKSVISRILRCNGYFVYDCDSEAKKIMVTNPRVKEDLIREMGEDIYLPDGGLNRGKLAIEVFGNEVVRQFVNGIVHAAVREDIKNKRRYVKGLFFIESAILATGKIAEMCNQIWLITAPMEERINRVVNRDNTDIASIKKRIESQEAELSLLDHEKIMIINNDNYHPVLPEVLKLTEKFNNYQEYKISC